MKKENTTEKVTDIDYAQCAVPAEGRKGFLTMFMIMLGFTFFSASMWVGQQLAEGLDFYGFIKSLILGGMILGLYTGLLGYVGAKTGLSMDLLAKRAFGEKGSYIACKKSIRREGLLHFLSHDQLYTDRLVRSRSCDVRNSGRE